MHNHNANVASYEISNCFLRLSNILSMNNFLQFPHKYLLSSWLVECDLLKGHPLYSIDMSLKFFSSIGSLFPSFCNLFFMGKPSHFPWRVSYILDFSDCLSVVLLKMFFCILHVLQTVSYFWGLVWFKLEVGQGFVRGGGVFILLPSPSLRVGTGRGWLMNTCWMHARLIS